MRYNDFSNLTPTQQLTLLIAMHVRNEMEDFHAKHLSDTQMKELNPIIRQAIYDVVSFTNQPPKTKLERRQAAQAINWLTMMIPDYWEVPEKTSGSLELPEERLNELFDSEDWESSSRSSSRISAISASTFSLSKVILTYSFSSHEKELTISQLFFMAWI